LFQSGMRPLLATAAALTLATLTYVAYVRKLWLIRLSSQARLTSNDETTPASGPGSITTRPARKEDIEHITTLSAAAGQKIVPGGGDFITHAWTRWWEMHPSLHFNELAMDGDAPLGFVRVECYGAADAPESGWLEGLRIHPDAQGRGVMSLLNRAVLSRVPPAVRREVYLAVGSSNERMRAICDSKYVYIGGYCMHDLIAGSPPESRSSYDAVSWTVRPLQAEDLSTAWAMLSAHPLYKANRLLLPGRFYGFRPLTRAALKDKIEHAHATGVFSAGTSSQAPRLVGIFFEFDDTFAMGDTVNRIHTCCFSPDVDTDGVGAALHSFGKSQPTMDALTNKRLRCKLSVGPFINDGSSGDVDPLMFKALTAANFTRGMATHLRVYKAP